MMVRVAVAALFALGVACKSEPVVNEIKEAGAESHVGVGVVKDIKREGAAMLVDHEEIPGFMMAMQMTMYLKDKSLAQGIEVGDKIEFRLSKEGEDWLVTRVKKIE